MTKQEPLFIRIDKTLKHSAQAKAKSEGRSLSGWIRYLIIKALEGK